MLPEDANYKLSLIILAIAILQLNLCGFSTLQSKTSLKQSKADIGKN